jgi:K+-sensing histidine kinase KdpD
MTGCAILIRIPFTGVLGDASPFLFYWPAVVTVALCFGLRPGLLATATAAVLANYFWMPPHGSFGLTKVEFLQLLTFSGVNVLMLRDSAD